MTCSRERLEATGTGRGIGSRPYFVPEAGNHSLNSLSITLGCPVHLSHKWRCLPGSLVLPSCLIYEDQPSVLHIAPNAPPIRRCNHLSKPVLLSCHVIYLLYSYYSPGFCPRSCRSDSSYPDWLIDLRLSSLYTPRVRLSYTVISLLISISAVFFSFIPICLWPRLVRTVCNAHYISDLGSHTIQNVRCFSQEWPSRVGPP